MILDVATGGCPSLLSSANICHAVHLITSQKPDNAVQLFRTLCNIINHPLSSKTTHRSLAHAGMKAVVKKKCPALSLQHHKACLNWALAHQDWTMDD